MSWTVIKEDENGISEKILRMEFELSKTDIIYDNEFKLIKYIDKYGDTTFNSLMFDDLISDLNCLKLKSPINIDQIEEVIKIVLECKLEPHFYLKFYGQ